MALPALASLSTLPTELLEIIIHDLDYNSIQALRSSALIFSCTVPRPRTPKILSAKSAAQLAGNTLIACGGCLRLLPHTRFSTKMLIRRRSPHADIAKKARFCNLCGIRDLPGEYRYQPGEVFDNHAGEWFLRCAVCGECKRTLAVPLDEVRRRKEVATCRKCEQRARRSQGSPAGEVKRLGKVNLGA